MERKRVVVTGLGIVSPVGNSVEDAWKNISNGVSGIGPIKRFSTDALEVHFGGEVRDFNPRDLFGVKEARHMDRFTQFGMAATQQAIADSKLDMAHEDPWEVGCLFGSGIGGIESIVEQSRQCIQRGPRVVNPFMVPMMLPDSAAGKIAIEFGLRGTNMAISTACATGNNVIGEAAEMIRRDAAQVMIAGSAEAAIIELAIAAFNNMTALSRRNDSPETASRPFDKTRDGFVSSEGSACLVLESLDHAIARGAPIYAEIVGYGCTDDAFHVTAPREDGSGAARSMTKALKNASVTINDIDYINAHGTSTQLNDASETRAIKVVFGEHAYDVPISSTKSATGHPLGAAGSMEAVFCIQSLMHQFIPPTINLHTPDPECDLNYTPNVGVKADLDLVMSNSFGFGGHNSTLIFKRYQNGHGGS